MRKVNKETVREILALLQFGVPKTKIATKKQLNRRTIWRIAKYPEKYLKT